MPDCTTDGAVPKNRRFDAEMVQVYAPEVGGFPGLRSETWGTRRKADPSLTTPEPTPKSFALRGPWYIRGPVRSG